MIITAPTNLFFTTDADIRINTVNCEGAMGRGIAYEYKQRYPEMFADYNEVCRQGLLRPGLLHIYTYPTIRQTIVNFPTKDKWREPSQLKWIDWGLRQLNLYIRSRPNRSVSIPALGCSNGGLQWSVVKPMIESRLAGLHLNPITLFEPGV